MNLTELIAHLRELEKKATPGPWFTLQSPWTDSDGVDRVVQTSEDPHQGQPVCDVQMIMEWDADCEGDPFAQDRANGRFIAASRSHLTTLLDAVESLSAENKVLRSHLEECEKVLDIANKRGIQLSIAKETLEWYGNAYNYAGCLKLGTGGVVERRAREALEKLK